MTTGMARAAAVSLVIGVMLGAAVAYLLTLRTQTFDDRLQPEAILEAGLLAEVPSFTEAGLRTQTAGQGRRIHVDRRVVPLPRHRVGDEVEGGGTGRRRRRHGATRWSALVRRRLRRARRRQDGDRGEHRPGGGEGRVQGPGGRRRFRRPGSDPSPRGDRAAPVRTARVGGRAHHTGEGARGRRVRHRPHRRASNDAGSAPPPRTAGQTMVAPADFFSIGATRQLLAGVTAEYEFVVVDTPPLLHRAYASTVIDHGAAGRGGGRPRQQGLRPLTTSGTGSS